MGEINVKVLKKGAPRLPKPGDTPEVEVNNEIGPKSRALVNKFAGAYYSKALKDLGQFNPFKITYEQMYMMSMDPIIKMAITYTIAPLANAPWRCEGEDPEQVALTEEALKEIYISLLKGYFTKLSFGHAGLLIRFKRAFPTYKYTDPETGEEKPVWSDDTVQAVVWSDPRPLPPETVEPAFTSDGSQFDGMYFTPSAGMKDQIKKLVEGKLTTEASTDQPKTEQIPVGNSLWAINEKEETFNNWAGYPRSGYAFRYWWSYWFRFVLADRHFEHDADPPMKVSFPPGVNEEGEQNADVAMRIGDDLREGGTIAVPSTPYTDDLGKPTGKPLWEAEFVTGGENMSAYQNSFDYLDVMKFRSMLVPEQTLIEGSKGTGARNVAAVVGKVFAESLGMLMDEFDKDVNKYMIPTFLAINFAEPKRVVKVTTGFRDIDMNLGVQLLQAIANSRSEELPIDLKQLLDEMGIPTTKVNIARTSDGKPIDDPNDPALNPETPVDPNAKIDMKPAQDADKVPAVATETGDK